MIGIILSLVLVAVLWGGTNPLIKRGSKDIIKIDESSKIKQFLLELKYLFTNVHYIVPMGLNQLGSVLYFFTLQSADVSVAVPVTNSLTFVFTAMMGVVLGETKPSKNTIFGMTLVLFGSFLCCYDKYAISTEDRRKFYIFSYSKQPYRNTKHLVEIDHNYYLLNKIESLL